MITDRPKLTTTIPPTGCLVSIFTVRINSKSFPRAVRRLFSAQHAHHMPYVKGYWQCETLQTLTKINMSLPTNTSLHVIKRVSEKGNNRYFHDN